MKSRVRSHSWVACCVRSVVPTRRCQLWCTLRGRSTSRGQMSSFTAWCPALFSVGQPLAKAGYMWRAMRLSPTNEVSIRSMVAGGTEERFLALHIEVLTSAVVKLAGDDGSASDVVCGMVRGRLPVPNCGEQCSLVSLGQPMVTVCHREKAGYMDWLTRLVPTNTVSTDLKYSTLMSRTLSWGSRCAHILVIL